MPRHAPETTCPLSLRCLPRARRASALWTSPHDPAVSPSARGLHAPRAAVLSAHRVFAVRAVGVARRHRCPRQLKHRSLLPTPRAEHTGAGWEPGRI